MSFRSGGYYSRDGYALFVISRKETTSKDGNINPRIYAEFGFGLPAYYKIHTRKDGSEYAVVKGHVFDA